MIYLKNDKATNFLVLICAIAVWFGLAQSALRWGSAWHTSEYGLQKAEVTMTDSRVKVGLYERMSGNKITLTMDDGSYEILELSKIEKIAFTEPEKMQSAEQKWRLWLPVVVITLLFWSFIINMSRREKYPAYSEANQ
jgi:hypothetical protein